MMPRPVVCPAVLAIALALPAAAAIARQADPANVDRTYTPDPARADAGTITLRRADADRLLDEIESLRAQLAERPPESPLSAEHQAMLARLRHRSGDLADQLPRGGSATSSRGIALAPTAAGNADLQRMIRDARGLQHSPEAAQVRGAMRELESLLLPMVQDMKNAFDAELRRRAASSR